MKIKMLNTLEDTHKWLEGEPNREELKFDTRVFNKGEMYDGENIPGDWNRRAKGLVSLGYAKEIS